MVCEVQRCGLLNTCPDNIGLHTSACQFMRWLLPAAAPDRYCSFHTSHSGAYMSHVTVTLSMSHVTLTVLSRLCSAAWDNLSKVDIPVCELLYLDLLAAHTYIINVYISCGSYEMKHVRPVYARSSSMACGRTVVVLLVFLCYSWYPRAEAANAEGRWSVRSYLISNL